MISLELAHYKTMAILEITPAASGCFSKDTGVLDKFDLDCKQFNLYSMEYLQMRPLRAKASRWVRLDESTKRYAIASRLHIY